MFFCELFEQYYASQPQKFFPQMICIEAVQPQKFCPLNILYCVMVKRFQVALYK